MERAQLVATDDLGYKNGFVQCKCGWSKELGDGFNGYHIEHCPLCTPELHTRIQDKVTTGRPGNYIIKYGRFTYFVIDSGIHVQFAGITYRQEFRKRLPR